MVNDRLGTCAVLLCGLLHHCYAASDAIAQSDYPSKPMRLIVPWPPGGPVDVTARLVGQKLGEVLGRQIVVDNRSGADGSIGTAFAAKTPADGYSLLIGSTSTHSINPIIYDKLAYVPARDFAPVIMLDTRPYILVLHNSIPARSVKELIALAKSRKGELAYASAGASNQAAGEQFKSMAGVDILHVPYSGGGPAMTALLGGHVAMFFAPVPIAVPHLQSGRVRALATTAARRAPNMPNLPTMSEGGLAGFEFSTWDGLFVPTGTPPTIVAKLNADVTKVLEMADIRDKFSELGASVAGGTPEQLTAHMKVDAEKWIRLLKSPGVRIE